MRVPHNILSVDLIFSCLDTSLWVSHAGTKVRRRRLRTFSFRVINSECVRTCLSPVTKVVRPSISKSDLSSTSNTGGYRRCLRQSCKSVLCFLSSKVRERRNLCTAHLNRSVGLITCERRLFGKTAKQVSGWRCAGVCLVLRED